MKYWLIIRIWKEMICWPAWNMLLNYREPGNRKNLSGEKVSIFSFSTQILCKENVSEARAFDCSSPIHRMVDQRE